MKNLNGKKGQINTGLSVVLGLILGIGSLIVSVILIFVFVQTVVDADLITSQSSSRINETSAHANGTGYTLLAETADPKNGAYSITAMWTNNASDGGGGVYNISIPAANYTLNVSAGAVLKNGTETNYNNVSVSYTFEARSFEQNSTDNLRANFTTGVDNVSKKIPTVLLIAGVVLLFAALAILAMVARNAGFFQGTGQVL